MNTQSKHIDFSTVLTTADSITLLNKLMALENLTDENTYRNKLTSYLMSSQQKWQLLTSMSSGYRIGNNTFISSPDTFKDSEYNLTNWLISLFNTLFLEQKVELVRGKQEPEYFPIQGEQLARIEFAHGFFASALHEISHWCVAGEARRRLSDFGYWYAPDGRSAAQQQAFERVEIKPQALECLFTLACGRQFQVSQDNLFAEFDTSDSTFASDVYQQVKNYITEPHTLPRDAKTLLTALLSICKTSLSNTVS
ncbi:elongation factor P hydroxylase [Psychrobacter sp. 1U1]|uniref:elongation factor P hydroxylase n=1 Tax=Psychrobacter sp. 1U1 TaxID=3453576 RepID=UPI003F466826